MCVCVYIKYQTIYISSQVQCLGFVHLVRFETKLLSYIYLLYKLYILSCLWIAKYNYLYNM